MTCKEKKIEEIKVKVSDVERLIGQKIDKNITVLGLDTASKTGWAVFKGPVVRGKINLEVGYIKSTKTGTEKFNELIPSFVNLILTNKPDYVIIEDTYWNPRFKNPKTVSIISRIGMIPYVICTLNSIPKNFLMASSVRSNIGLSPSTDKQGIVDYVNHYLNIKIDDHDIADAIVLALNGFYGETKKIKKEKTIGLFRGISKNKKRVAKKSKNSSSTKQKKKVTTKTKKRT